MKKTFLVLMGICALVVSSGCGSASGDAGNAFRALSATTSSGFASLKGRETQTQSGMSKHQLAQIANDAIETYRTLQWVNQNPQTLSSHELNFKRNPQQNNVTETCAGGSDMTVIGATGSITCSYASASSEFCFACTGTGEYIPPACTNHVFTDPAFFIDFEVDGDLIELNFQISGTHNGNIFSLTMILYADLSVIGTSSSTSVDCETKTIAGTGYTATFTGTYGGTELECEDFAEQLSETESPCES